jgi:hypothetical protein
MELQGCTQVYSCPLGGASSKDDAGFLLVPHVSPFFSVISPSGATSVRGALVSYNVER